MMIKVLLNLITRFSFITSTTLFSPQSFYPVHSLSFPIFLHPSSPTPLVLSIIHYTLYSYSSFPLSSTIYLLIYLHFSPHLSPQLSLLTLLYIFLLLQLPFSNPLSLPFTSPLVSSPSISFFIAFPADLIDCPSVVLHDFGLSEFTSDDSDIIWVLN